jgi:hypothetical protein
VTEGIQEEKWRERDKREKTEGRDRGREIRCERLRAYRHMAGHRVVERQEGETEERRNSGREGGRKRGRKWRQRGRYIGRETDKETRRKRQ